MLQFSSEAGAVISIRGSERARAEDWGRGRSRRRWTGIRCWAGGSNGSGGGNPEVALLTLVALDALHVLKAMPRAAASFHVRCVAEGRMAEASLTRSRTRTRGSARTVDDMLPVWTSRADQHETRIHYILEYRAGTSNEIIFTCYPSPISFAL